MSFAPRRSTGAYLKGQDWKYSIFRSRSPPAEKRRVGSAKQQRPRGQSISSVRSPNEKPNPPKNVTLRTRREAQGPQGFGGTASGISPERQNELQQPRHEIV